MLYLVTFFELQGLNYVPRMWIETILGRSCDHDNAGWVSKANRLCICKLGSCRVAVRRAPIANLELISTAIYCNYNR